MLGVLLRSSQKGAASSAPIRRALAFLKTFESYILDGRLLKSSDFHKALRYLSQEEEDDDATPTSLAAEMDAQEEVQHILQGMQTVDPLQYDLRKLHEDVLSEGQNLQDCGHLVNYDLHWNPTRMVQRAGRIDRIGTDFDTLWIYNLFPDEGLERLLGLVESLSRKIADIDRAGFLDASVLGETVHPQNFNALCRIRAEDGSVIEEEEQFSELASSEFLLQQLRTLLGAGGQEMLASLPDGIHSGLVKANAKGVFFYFQACPPEGEKQHFWKFFDLQDQRIIDNRYVIANLIACDKDTPRVMDPGIFSAIFELQERIIEDILRSVQEQKALEVAPRVVDPLQQTVATTVQGYLHHPAVDRRKAIELIRFLNQPMLVVQIRELRQVYKDFQSKEDIISLVTGIERLREKFGGEHETNQRVESSSGHHLQREGLRLICFDLVTGDKSRDHCKFAAKVACRRLT